MLGSDTEIPARMVLLLIVYLPKPTPGTDPAQADARWTNGSMGVFLLCDYLASLLEKQDEGKKTEATHTSRHRPHSEAGWRRSLRRIFHPQPSSQIIGDQTFGPYAIFERKEKLLSE